MADQIFDLRVRNLTVFGPRGRALVTIPRLEAPAGCALGIQGPSGAGKSTLLFALAGLAAPTSGEVLWGKTDILDLDERRRAAFRTRHIGMVFQDFLLFDELDAATNAGLKALFSRKRDRAGLRSASRDLLAALEVPVEARTVANYSGGERQRIALARALAHDPLILLADEPTASLHREASDALIDDLLARVRDRGCTLIVVSHDDRLLDRMDRVVTLADGVLAGGMAV